MNNRRAAPAKPNIVSSIRHHLSKLLTSKLAKASSLMFVSTIGGGILGYIFQVIMGRLLSVSDYGLFIILMAILLVAAVPLGTLGMVVSRQASKYWAKNQSERVAAMYWWVNRRVLWVGLAVVLCALPFTSFLQDYVRLDSFFQAWIFLFMVFVSLFVPVNYSFLQAQQNFRWYSIYILAVPTFRIIFCVALVLAGFKLSGALMGMALASIATWLITYYPIRPVVSRPAGVVELKDHFSIKSTIPVLIANISFALMTQIDILLVSNYFDKYQVGIYASASILGKAVMYLPGAIVVAMFPMVVEKESRSQSSSYYLFNAMALTGVLSSAGALFYFFFADEIMTLLYGQKYEGAAELLKYYGFAILPFTLVMVAEHFLIAKGQVIFAYVMILGIPFVLLAAQIYHDNLIDIVYILAVCGWGLALVGFGVVGVQYFLRGVRK